MDSCYINSFSRKREIGWKNEDVDANNNDFEQVKTKSTRRSISNDKKVIKFESTIK